MIGCSYACGYVRDRRCEDCELLLIFFFLFFFFMFVFFDCVSDMIVFMSVVL